MINTKKRVALYYAAEDLAEMKSLRDLARKENTVMMLLDAQAFEDVEQVDSIQFSPNVPDWARRKIEAAYSPEQAAPVVKDDNVIEIPEDWADLSWPELQKLAASLTEDTVRTKDAAIGIIEAELERRADEERSDEEASDEVDLESMTKAQLVEYAEGHGIDLGDASKKADIIAAIEAAQE